MAVNHNDPRGSAASGRQAMRPEGSSPRSDESLRMNVARRQRVAALFGLAVAIILVPLGLVQDSWQIVVGAALLGALSVVVISARSAALEAWSDRMEHSWSGVLLTASGAAVMWGFA